MPEPVISNARMILADEVRHGAILVRNGMIADISGNAAQHEFDFEGDYLVPGLVELHTDHLESHFHPRPGVAWPAVSAVVAHDSQMAASGITTVFDAVRAGSFDPDDVSARSALILVQAINVAQNKNLLRAAHYIHVRCELPCPDTLASLETLAEASTISLVSLMDHTPGARQFHTIDSFIAYYVGKKLLAPAEVEKYVADRIAQQKAHAPGNKAGIIALARAHNIRLASHDDATADHVAEAVADGVDIAEFPTTLASARLCHEQGISVMMGAPNVVRGGSHSGNIAATDIARDGCLDILSSDYVPNSLLAAAFVLPEMAGLSLPQSIALVSRNSARAVDLFDRGEIATGLRADLLRVHMPESGPPIVRAVWRQGQRVL